MEVNIKRNRVSETEQKNIVVQATNAFSNQRNGNAVQIFGGIVVSRIEKMMESETS